VREPSRSLFVYRNQPPICPSTLFRPCMSRGPHARRALASTATYRTCQNVSDPYAHAWCTSFEPSIICGTLPASRFCAPLIPFSRAKRREGIIMRRDATATHVPINPGSAAPTCLTRWSGDIAHTFPHSSGRCSPSHRSRHGPYPWRHIALIPFTHAWTHGCTVSHPPSPPRPRIVIAAIAPIPEEEVWEFQEPARSRAGITASSLPGTRRISFSPLIKRVALFAIGYPEITGIGVRACRVSWRCGWGGIRQCVWLLAWLCGPTGSSVDHPSAGSSCAETQSLPHLLYARGMPYKSLIPHGGLACSLKTD
jgi:hypothetical protein